MPEYLLKKEIFLLRLRVVSLLIPIFVAFGLGSNIPTPVERRANK